MASRTPADPSPTAVAGLETDEQTARRIADLVAESFAAEDVAVSLFDAGGGRWQVAIYFRAAPDREAVRAVVASAAGREAAQALTFARVEATDWVRESLAGLAPVAAGRFVVHGAHDRAGIPVNRVGIEIEAALAFGTGHHGTTRGCLLALDDLCKSPPRERRSWRILDLGTGSGVLAIAAARALRRRVLATDIDAGAVRVARANARLNRAGAMVEVVKADGVTARQRAPTRAVRSRLRQHSARPAAADRRAAQEAVGPGRPRRRLRSACAQANAAMAAYRPLVLERRIDLDGWTTLVLARRTRRRGTSI